MQRGVSLPQKPRNPPQLHQQNTTPNSPLIPKPPRKMQQNHPFPRQFHLRKKQEKQ
jgi:hypothetical protein